MPTKTERILSYLPPTFRPAQQLSALEAVADAFGTELLLAENSLVNVMRAHWVDHADRGAEVIDDLARIAALYGLAPRPDESVEEFREHLKRYIRTFLEGTVTVQGTLRVTAEALGLRIADAYEDLDTWWTRGADGDTLQHQRFTTRATVLDEATQAIFGFISQTARGTPATSARIVGTADLSRGVDLREAGYLRLVIDDQPAVEIYCAGQRPRATLLEEIVAAINRTLTIVLGLENIASSDQGRYLVLTSHNLGIDSRLEIASHQVSLDALDTLLGIEPGTFSTPVVGLRDLSSGVDLESARFLRLAVNGRPQIDVDCAAQVQNSDELRSASLQQIVAAINEQLGEEIASDDGAYLTLQAPAINDSPGQITLAAHISGDASQLLLKPENNMSEGNAAAPAKLTGTVDLLTPVDLSQRQLIRLAVDSDSPVEINVAGTAPETTFLDEIVAAINDVLPGLASATDDDRLQLTSPTPGLKSRLALLPLRYLELIEYPPEPTALIPPNVTHGDRWHVDNMGAAESVATIDITAVRGISGPQLVNLTLGQRIRLLIILSVGERVRLWQDPQGRFQAILIAENGAEQPVDPARILVGPVGEQSWAPFAGVRYLRRGTRHGADSGTTLQLNNPTADKLVRLRSQPGCALTVTVAVCEHSLEHPPSSIPADASVGRVRQIEEDVYHLVDGQETAIAHLQIPPSIDPTVYQDRVVIVTGTQQPDNPPLIQVNTIAHLFDVTLCCYPANNSENSSEHSGEDEADANPPSPVEEHYRGVTIGVDATVPQSLVYQINIGPNFSALVIAETLDKAAVLTLPLGRSLWLYQDCSDSRFNQANFDRSMFAGQRCRELGIFDASRFAQQPVNDELPPLEHVSPVFALSESPAEATATVSFHWPNYQPGAFRVNLPADLPPRFGGRFNTARFSQSTADDGSLTPELFAEVVTAPPGDADYIVARINSGENKSTLVTATFLSQDVPPLGWNRVEIPFRKPQLLTRGNQTRPAQIYLGEAGVSGLIKLEARQAGTWGNDIAVSARQTRPAMYDLSIFYQGARFENARRVVLGDPLPALTKDLLMPGPIGILQAKAAGVRVGVSRDTCGELRE